MKFKSIKTRMIALILPIIVVAMALFTIVSVLYGRNIINTQIDGRMIAEREAKSNAINMSLNNVTETAKTLAKTIAESYKSTDKTELENILKSVALQEDLFLGAGIWFEPNVYDKNEKYMGPYAAVDGGKASITYDYSNADYDYLNQEYYTLAKSSQKVIVTKPYYDDTSKQYMSSCSAPIIDAAGTYLGCITVDIKLDSLQKLITSAKIGDAGKAFLLSPEGIYLANQTQSKVEKGENITKDSNASLASAGQAILANKIGETSYTADGSSYRLYYATIPGVDWKIVFEIPMSEINGPVLQMMGILIAIGVVVIIVTSLSILLQVSFITTRIRKVKEFLEKLAAKKYTTPDIHISAKDEIGKMGESLNSMYGSNKAVITDMANFSHELNDSSNNLNEASDRLITQFRSIQEYMSVVNEAMMATSAATEEVNASAEEVDSYISLMSEEAASSRSKTAEIGENAQSITKKSEDAFGYASRLSKEYQSKLTTSIRNIEVVDSIGEMAGVIAGIADQINLLSLNASIEAARAGEHGSGFAVVASEIGKLANDTSRAVSRISETIVSVKTAVDELAKGSGSLLDFVEQTVTPDYNYFIDVAKQYGSDAKEMYENAERIAEMSENIKRIMDEVGDAIANITESTQTTAENSGKTLSSIEDVATVVDQISEMSDHNKSISGNLTQIVNEFEL